MAPLASENLAAGMVKIRERNPEVRNLLQNWFSSKAPSEPKLKFCCEQIDSKSLYIPKEEVWCDNTRTGRAFQFYNLPSEAIAIVIDRSGRKTQPTSN